MTEKVIDISLVEFHLASYVMVVDRVKICIRAELASIGMTMDGLYRFGRGTLKKFVLEIQ